MSHLRIGIFVAAFVAIGCGRNDTKKTKIEPSDVSSVKDIQSSLDQFQSDHKGLVDQISKSARDQDRQNREKTKSETEKNKQRLALRETERAKQDAFLKDRKAESELKEKEKAASDQAERQQLADQVFGGVTFDPDKCVILSKSLKKSGATVQIVGRTYQDVRAFHAKKDWLGLINFLNKNDPSKGYRSTDDVLDKFYHLGNSYRNDQQGLQLLVKSKNDLRKFDDETSQLFAFEFPLTVDLSSMYSMSADAEQDYRYRKDKFRPATIEFTTHFTRHPDGAGYFRAWTPLRLVLVGLDTERGKNETGVGGRYQSGILQEFDKKHDYLRAKQDLGELNEEDIRRELTIETVRLYHATKKWLDNF